MSVGLVGKLSLSWHIRELTVNPQLLFIKVLALEREQHIFGPESGNG